MRDEDITTLDCPKCPTGKLVHRRNKLTHEWFLGCTNYPNCKYTEKEPPQETDGVADAASVWE